MIRLSIGSQQVWLRPTIAIGLGGESTVARISATALARNLPDLAAAGAR